VTAHVVRAEPGELGGQLAELRASVYTRAEVVPLAALERWVAGPDAIVHDSGRFFRIEGISAGRDGTPGWQQPIINQPETGILGLLLRRVDGVLSGLVQLKPEPGNCNGLQVSPTVQATRSNFTGAHGGSAVPFVDDFAAAGGRTVVTDLLQSEHNAWFLRKGNRNVVIHGGAGIEPPPGFLWLGLTELYRMLAEDDLVNADLRSVLGCLVGPGLPDLPVGVEGFRGALARSCAGLRSAHPLADLLGWIERERSRSRLAVAPVRLADLRAWKRDGDRITHRDGRYFDVIGVRVEASGREVRHWSQPMLAPHEPGLLAVLVTRIDAVLHLLVQLRAEPGCADGAELAPTVQCTPANYDHLPARHRPRFLDDVRACDPAAIRFDSVLSDEGGRFHHSRCRHLVIETPWIAEPPGHRWVTVQQLAALLRRGRLVNMQARSMLACLGALALRSGGPP
jgi:dTDP-4-dehydro-6-deoxy-alpha-D-glucopyranose 2,3-dehydratase